MQCLISTFLPEQSIPLCLPPPLIPLPVLGLEMIEDIFYVGNSPPERWRSYINAGDWSPAKINGKLLKKRAYHARVAYEATLLLSFTDSSWLSTESYRMIQQVAMLELRTVEFELMSYQLTCGTIGLILENRDKLFVCATLMFTTQMWLADKIMDAGEKSFNKRKALVELGQARPFSVDSTKELAVQIDEYIYGIQEMMKKGSIMITKNTTIIEDLTNKLRLCIRAFDDVAKVVAPEDNIKLMTSKK